MTKNPEDPRPNGPHFKDQALTMVLPSDAAGGRNDAAATATAGRARARAIASEAGRGPTFKNQVNDAQPVVNETGPAYKDQVHTVQPKTAIAIPESAAPTGGQANVVAVEECVNYDGSQDMIVPMAPAELVHVTVSEHTRQQHSIHDEDTSGAMSHGLTKLKLTRKKLWIFAIITIATIVVLVAVVVSVLVGKGKSNSGNDDFPATSTTNANPSTSAPIGIVTPPPTKNPTLAPTKRSHEYAKLRKAVMEHFGAETMHNIDNDNTSPQAKAFEWLIATNTTTGDDVDSAIRFKQRYALATFAYSTSIFQWKTATHWLSDDVHECEWFALKCDENQRIHSIHLDKPNFLAGSIPTELAGLTYLWLLYIIDNGGLTGTIPTELASIEPLERLRLRDLSLEGPIPDEFNAKFNLEFLYLNGNLLTGTIPSRIGALPRLKYCYFYGNSLTGTLPKNLLESTTLEELSVRDNKLTGRVDALNIFGADYLDRLNLGDNLFSGPLPEELRKRTNLEDLVLNNNFFSGTLPASYSALHKLETLNVEGNNITGSIGPDLCDLRSFGIEPATSTELAQLLTVPKLTQLTADCMEEVTCDCCTECY